MHVVKKYLRTNPLEVRNYSEFFYLELLVILD